MQCEECGGKVHRYHTPPLCEPCLNGGMEIKRDEADLRAIQCSQCKAWTAQPIFKADLWDANRRRPWCPSCVEASHRPSFEGGGRPDPL